MVTTQVQVKARYRLSVTRAEQAAMRRVLAHCPTTATTRSSPQTVPISVSGPPR